MSGERVSMEIRQEILRLKGLGHSKFRVGKLLGINRETVRKYWSGDAILLEKDFPNWFKKLDSESLKKEILKKTPLKILHEELSYSHQLPSYQAFCKFLRNNFKDEQSPKVAIKIFRSPGDSIEVDYSGNSISILNQATGELIRTELFVGVLSYSGKFFAEFSYSQKLEDFISSHNRMFFYFGGVPKYIVPDNLKSAVTRCDKYDPKINKTYKDLCDYFAVTVDPADPYSPRHKAHAEAMVGFIQRDFFPRIRNKTYTSLYEANKDLREWIDLVSDQVMKDRGSSRNTFFEKEKEFLRPLPRAPYEIFYFKKAKVHPDSHIQHDRNFYSVPYQFVGKEVEIKFNSNIVHVFSGIDRIATHKTSPSKWHHVTHKEHLPHQKNVDIDFHFEQAKSKAKLIGNNMKVLVEKLIQAERFPLKNLRKIQGILSLQKILSKEELEYGARYALEINKLSYNCIKSFSRGFKYQVTPKYNVPRRQLEFTLLQGEQNE